MKLGTKDPIHLSAVYYVGGCTSCGSWWGSEKACCKFSKLYFPLEGEMEIEAQGKILIGKPGDMFLIPEGMPHSFRLTSMQKVKKYWFHFNLFPNILKTAFEQQTVPICVQVDQPKKVKRAFEYLLKLAEDTGSLRAKIMLQSQIFKLIGIYMEQAEKSGVDFTNHQENVPSLGFVAQYIIDNIERPVSLEELATLANLHPNYLIRIFKQQFGTTPVKYLNNMRLERMISLICNTDLPFQEIIQKTGFSEPAYFSGFFKRETGYSPREYRRYHRQYQAPPPNKEL